MANEKISPTRPNPVPQPPPGAKPAPAPVPSPSGKSKAKKKDERRDFMREVWETVVFVVVLVLMLKTFVAEAFVIPTGSMASTLYGYQKIVTCEQCQHVFPVNCSSEIDPQNGPARLVTGCVCPNCSLEMHWKVEQTTRSNGDVVQRVNGPEWYTGDRVLVAKFLFDDNHLWTPHRHDVFVFKYPTEPQRGTTAMNYIKRCEGLPLETVAIFNGNLYVTKSLTHPLPTGDAMDFWKPENMHVNDPAAVELFKNSLERRALGQPAAGDFEILRKPPAQQLAMRRIVFDNDFQPKDLALQADYRRWRFADKKRWTGDSVAGPKVFAHAGTTSDDSDEWLTYHHRLRDFVPHNLPEKPGHFKDDPRRLITNQQGYNTGEGDHNQDRFGEFWVGDLMLDCTVKVNKPEGEFVLELGKGVDRFQARFDVGTGQCSLVRVTSDGSAPPKKAILAQKTTKLKGTGSWHVRFGNFDQRLTVWVDKSLPFGDGVAYDPPRSFGPSGENDLEPARIGALKADLAVSHLQLWRDSYYTLNKQNWRAETVSVDSYSSELQTFYVQPDHYLALGDNSGASADSRYWGLVPQRLLLGRALMVYFPLWPLAVQTRVGFIE